MSPEIQKNRDNHLNVSFIEASGIRWYEEVDELREQLGAPDNRFLFPPHFIKKTLISIGGGLVKFTDEQGLKGAGFIFPRNNRDGFDYTMRIHESSFRDVHLNYDEVVEQVQNALSERVQRQVTVIPYNPESQVQSSVVEKLGNGLQIVRSSAGNPSRVRELQKEIWDVAKDDFLYPVDIHLDDFALATTLLAYYDARAVGFLFGFDKYDEEVLPPSLAGHVKNSRVRVESQLMGVLPEFRNQNIAWDLKIQQGKDALEKGVEIVNWTFDPLQSANANLNLNKLGGVIFHHYPDYYAFAGANKLNQVVASRFAVTWLVGSPRVQDRISGKSREGDFVNDVMSGVIPTVNSTVDIEKDGFSTRRIESADFDVNSRLIAIEVPVNWTDIQLHDLDLAKEWRNITDDLFKKYIGPADNQYVVFSAAVYKEGKVPKRSFLIAKPTSELGKIYLGKD